MVHSEVFYVGFYYFFIYKPKIKTRVNGMDGQNIGTYQVRSVTAHRNQMFGRIVSGGSDKSINFPVLMNNSDTFPVTDVHATVNTDGNSLGECQSCLVSWPTISASENI